MPAPARMGMVATTANALGGAAVRLGGAARRSPRLLRAMAHLRQEPESSAQAVSASPEARPLLAAPPLPGAPGGDAPLTPPVRSAAERSFGVDFGAVRVHSDARAGTAAEQLSARAFTYGNHVFLGRGEQSTDVRLLSHELAHVVQQQGAPAVQKSAPGQDGPHEREADRASQAASRGESFNVSGRTSVRLAMVLDREDEESSQLIREGLESPDTEVRANAATAVMHLRWPGFRDTVLRARARETDAGVANLLEALSRGYTASTPG